jgi:hypothetical protein
VATGAKAAAAAGAKISWPQATRDVFVAAINRGQLPVLIFGLTALLMVWKLPDSEVGPLMHRILDRLEGGAILGWALATVLAIVWYLHSRAVRARFAEALEQAQKGGGNA